MIAFLHTSDIHIDTFEKLVRNNNPQISVKHFVNKELLDFALKEGHTDTKSFRRQVSFIEDQNPDMIICTCSTYGQECDQYSDVHRIDYPIVEFLVLNYKRIGLVYTAASTKKVSEDLIHKTAIEKKRAVQIICCDCSDSWKYYEHNDFLNYSKSVADKVMQIGNKVDVIFLAQASMEGAKHFIKDSSIKIYSSPEFGMNFYLDQELDSR